MKTHKTPISPPFDTEKPEQRTASLTVVEPRAGWRALDLRELWQYRELLYFLTWRDVKVRYKQTLLGAAWAIFQPTMMAAVFTFVLGRYANVPSGNVPYLLFAFTGMLPWVLFSGAVTQAGNSVVAAERVVTKVYFPRLAIPVAAVGAALVDFGLASVMLVGLMFWYGVVPGWTLLLLPLSVLMLCLVALGLGSLLAALMVAYRDVRYILPFLIQLLLFATPSIYMDPEASPQAQPPVHQSRTLAAKEVPGSKPDRESGRGFRLLDLHPLNGAISFFRATVLGRPIKWVQLGWSSLLGLAIFAGGCLYFRKVEDTFADII